MRKVFRMKMLHVWNRTKDMFVQRVAIYWGLVIGGSKFDTYQTSKHVQLQSKQMLSNCNSNTILVSLLLYLIMSFLVPHWYLMCSSTSENLYQFARAAITKCQGLGGLNNRNLFSLVLEARNPTSRCKQGWFSLILLSLTCQWPTSSPYVFI
jgi:hypothetical protein